MSISHTNHLLSPLWFKELLFWFAKHRCLWISWGSLCFIHPDKSGLVSLAPLKCSQERYETQTVCPRGHAVKYPPRSVNWKSWPTHMMCDCLSLQSVRFVSHSACSKAPSYTRSPSDLKIIQSEAKGCILCLPVPKSCLLIAWCVLNGPAERQRQRGDEWILCNNWHIRDQLIKATG